MLVLHLWSLHWLINKIVRIVVERKSNWKLMFGTRIEFESEAQDITSEGKDGDGCKNSFTCPVPFNGASNWTYAMERFHPWIPSISAFSSITARPCLSYWTAKGFAICQSEVVVVVFEGRIDKQDGQRTDWQTSKPFIVGHIHGRTSCCSVLLLIMLFVDVLLSCSNSCLICWRGLLIRLRNMDMNRILLYIIILTPFTFRFHGIEVVLEIF